MNIKSLVEWLVRTDRLARAAAQFVKSKMEPGNGDPELWFQDLVTAYSSYGCECGNAEANHLLSQAGVFDGDGGLQVVREGDTNVASVSAYQDHQILVSSPGWPKPLFVKDVTEFSLEEAADTVLDTDGKRHPTGVVRGKIHYTRVLRRRNEKGTDQT